ncbi:hypothetical protein ACFQI3_13005 [Hansschlegelia quercus]|uniref:Uncharacterized protein n=1 Tax=Hansschlegelia quercus TaxID=2528245 RepID=A0A4Q9GJK0_9HYPH|nr:hypothetical protein [Hansschlegelia quercus]TBN53245.1 hypothetical protein EYR15_09440 [Hansschlegelia quercus]
MSGFLSWLRFGVIAAASLLGVLFLTHYVAITYAELDEPWFWGVVVCGFSVVVSVLAMGKEQNDEDRRLSGD